MNGENIRWQTSMQNLSLTLDRLDEVLSESVDKHDYVKRPQSYIAHIQT